MVFRFKNVFFALALTLATASAQAQVCKQTDGKTPDIAKSTLTCDMTYYNTVVSCDKSGGSQTFGTRPSCPAKPMPMLDTQPKPMPNTQQKSLIASYSPYLFAFARNPDDKTTPYVGSNYRGTPGDMFDGMFGGGTDKQLTGKGENGAGDESTKKSLAPCVMQIPNTKETDPIKQAKYVRFQLDNCANQYIEQAAVYPFQKEASQQFSGEQEGNAAAKTNLLTECQPIKTFTETDSEYNAADYLRNCWIKTLEKPGHRNPPTGDPPVQAINEPHLPTDLKKLESPIAPPAAINNITLASIATVPYEEITYVCHPFGPREDFAFNERDHYSPQTSQYMAETKNAVYCAGVRDATAAGNSNTKENLEVKVDVLSFRRPKFEEGITSRITYNNTCFADKNGGKIGKEAIISLESYCYVRIPTEKEPDRVRSLNCWECFGLGGKLAAGAQPPCSTRYDAQDLTIDSGGGEIGGGKIPGAYNNRSFQATCSAVQGGPRNNTHNIDTLCKDLRKPLTPLNKLRMVYHNPDDPEDPKNEAVVLRSGVPEGMTFKEYFSNHMPYIRPWNMAGGSIHKFANSDGNNQLATDTAGQYTAIVGVGREGAPGAENSQAVKDHPDQRCLYGGWGGDVTIEDIGTITVPDPITSWTELKAYQANTLRRAGISCIGRYEKVFKSGSTENLALSTSGAEYPQVVIMKCPKQSSGTTDCEFMDIKQYEDAGKPQSDDSYTYVKQFKNEAWVLNWRGYMASGIDGKKFPELGGGSASKTGLDNAEAGDIILMPTGAVDGGKPGLAKIARVTTEINVPKTSDCETKKNCYVMVEEADNGKFPDSCGTTDHWGQMRKRRLYKPDHLPPSAVEEMKRVGSTTDCEDTKLQYCEFKLWDKVKVYEPDEKKGCDKEKAGDCPEDTGAPTS